MRMPGKVRVGHQTLPIIREDIAETDNAVGMYHDGTERSPCIVLDRRLRGQEVARVLLHELTHAILNCYMPVETYKAVFEKRRLPRQDVEEMVADAMGKGLMQVVRDNPALWRWLQGHIGEHR
ncbi:MAG TPA: hypothetical protein PKN52_00115 [Trueperaceae bacterium]|nr:hypothetical protein [Trueperaceae bacterium]